MRSAAHPPPDRLRVSAARVDVGDGGDLCATGARQRGLSAPVAAIGDSSRMTKK
jgi:hypothetical protein